MSQEETKHEELKRLLVNAVGIDPKTPKDFARIAEAIKDRTKNTISTTTLKRWWGYISVEPGAHFRTSVLDIISQAVGYPSWGAFVTSETDVNGSDFLFKKTVTTKDLAVGDTLRLLWAPNRCVNIRYEGNNTFTVIDSVNSKLMAGDKFCCFAFVEKEELLLTDITREGMVPCSYKCGKAGGILFDVTSRN